MSRTAPAPPWAVALGGYAATRLIGLAVLFACAAATGKDGLHRLMGRWDAVWYTRIAEHGYGYQVTLPHGGVHADLAFFPLFPALERALSTVLPVDAATAGLLLSWTASLAAAWGIYAVGAHVAGERAGILLAVLWGVYPTAFVQSMAYTETLFTALAAWSLLAVLRGRWILAGTLCALAGLTRPTAAALIAAIGITALVTLVRQLRAAGPDRAAARVADPAARTAGPDRAAGPDRTAGPDRAIASTAGPARTAARVADPAARAAGPDRVADPIARAADHADPPAPAAPSAPGAAPAARASHDDRPALPAPRLAPVLTGALLAPLGWLAYIVYVGVRQGSATAYFDVQAAWGNSIDGGVALARFIVGLPWPAALGLCAALGLLGWLVALCVRQRQPLPLLVYTVAVVAISLVGAAYFGSRPRLMMPAFGLLLPPAVALARLRTRTAVPVLAVLALASAGYGAFTLLGSGPP